MNRMDNRSEILQAASEAARVLESSDQGKRASFDIVGAIAERNIPLVFRPLDRLWGALVTVEDGARGIMVASRLGLAVQRFTLAHEFGHWLLGHESSLDESESIDFAGRHGSGSRAIEEVAADTFAAELLASERLMMESAKRHGWARQALRQPRNIYQLALRLGISYQAACWGLVTAEVLARAEARQREATPVNELKRELAPAELTTKPWADVWALTSGDADTFLEAGPDDLFAVHLEDNVSAGYIWKLIDAGDNAEIVGERPADSEAVADPEAVYGRPSKRIVYVRFKAPGTHRLAFEHIRPWSGATLDQIEIEVDGFGKENDGLARRVKLDALANAA